MNPRLRALVRQAGLDNPDFPIEDWDNVPLAKFAELIVRESATLSWLHGGRTEARDLVLKHFGVEE